MTIRFSSLKVLALFGLPVRRLRTRGSNHRGRMPFVTGTCGSGGSVSARPGDKQGRFGEEGVRRHE